MSASVTPSWVLESTASSVWHCTQVRSACAEAWGHFASVMLAASVVWHVTQSDSMDESTTCVAMGSSLAGVSSPDLGSAAWGAQPTTMPSASVSAKTEPTMATKANPLLLCLRCRVRHEKSSLTLTSGRRDGRPDIACPASMMGRVLGKPKPPRGETPLGRSAKPPPAKADTRPPAHEARAVMRFVSLRNGKRSLFLLFLVPRLQAARSGVRRCGPTPCSRSCCRR